MQAGARLQAAELGSKTRLWAALSERHPSAMRTGSDTSFLSRC